MARGRSLTADPNQLHLLSGSAAGEVDACSIQEHCISLAFQHIPANALESLTQAAGCWPSRQAGVVTVQPGSLCTRPYRTPDA